MNNAELHEKRQWITPVLVSFSDMRAVRSGAYTSFIEQFPGGNGTSHYSNSVTYYSIGVANGAPFS